MTAAPATLLVHSGLELMGDGFMKLPFLRALRGTWPEARVSWVAGRGKTVYAGALRPLAAPYLDEIIEEARIGLSWRELLVRPLGGRRFDLVIDTQRGVRTTLILRRVRHGQFVSAAADFLLSERRPERGYRRPPAMAAQLLDLVRIAAGRDPVLAPPPVLPQPFRDGAALALPPGPAILGLVPGAGGRHKCWPRERYAALAQQAIAGGKRAAFILGPAEVGWLGALRAEVPGALFPLQEHRLDPALAASPLFTMAVGERVILAVTNDCGTAHMLAAAGTALVSLFGPTRAEKFAPAAADLTIITAERFGGSEMAAIPLEAVAAAALPRLNAP